MAKYFLSTIIVFLFGLILLSPAPALAAYNTVTFADSATTSLWGIPLDLLVSSGSNVASITVNSTNLSIGMESGSSITITDSSRKVLNNSQNASITCNEYYSRITLNSVTTETLTVTPTGDTCGTVSPATGGTPSAPASSPTPAATVEEPEPEPEVEAVVEPLPTATVAAVAVAVTAAEGGTVEATTDQGARAKLELPANAVTADAKVTITPTASTAGTVAAKVAAVPATQSVVGGYVYDYSATVADEAVSTFEQDVTVSFTYTELQITGLDESTLTIAYYDETTSAWVELVTTVDTANNKVTALTGHLTLFTLLGKQAEAPTASVAKPITEMTIAELKAEIARIAGLIAELQLELLKMIGVSGQLTLNLKLGDRGDEVELLQTWLANDTAVYPEGIVSGWFGPLTKAAVIKFQEKYFDEVLAPWNFTSGTGYVGSTTRAQLNALYGGQ